MPDTDDIVAALRATDAVRFGEFELSHGGTSDYYVDKYLFETAPDCLELLAEAFAARVGDTTLAGVALGAVPLVATTSVATGNPYVIACKQAKEYGTGNRVEGRLREGEAVVVVDRQEGAGEHLADHGVELEALVTAADLLERR